MNTLEAIAARRSIRKFKSDPVPDEHVRTILTAATQAPSARNRQPWRFVVIQGDKVPEMIQVFRQGMENMKARGFDIGTGEFTAGVMAGAPLTIFVYNPHGRDPWEEHDIEQNFMNLVNIQSIGAAIQNMCLAAQDLGLASLWVADVFEAYGELREWMGAEGQMVAAVSFGYPDEDPGPRPRMSVDEVARWL